MDRADALRVLRVLTAAFPTHPITEDTTELYVRTLIERAPDVATALAVVMDWSTTQLYFPKIAEFVDAYGKEAFARERAARQRQLAQEHYRPGTVACTSCDDTGMQLWNDDSGRSWTAPCESCRPDERAYWREGHYDKGHNVRSCSHPRCDQRARSKGRAR